MSFAMCMVILGDSESGIGEGVAYLPCSTVV